MSLPCESLCGAVSGGPGQTKPLPANYQLRRGCNSHRQPAAAKPETKKQSRLTGANTTAEQQFWPV